MIFIKKNLSYKIRKDLSESDEHKEILSLEVSCKNSSNILLSCCYKPPKGDNDILSMFLKQVFKKSTAEKKPYYLIGDLNISIFFSIITSKLPQNSSPLWLKKHFFNESNLASFKNQISSINWDILNSTQSSTNCLYETFLNIFSEIYDVNFPLTEIEIKPKNLKTPWFSKGLKKSSKTKQRLYIKFLKNKSAKSEKKPTKIFWKV